MEQSTDTWKWCAGWQMRSTQGGMQTGQMDGAHKTRMEASNGAREMEEESGSDGGLVSVSQYGLYGCN